MIPKKQTVYIQKEKAGENTWMDELKDVYVFKEEELSQYVKEKTASSAGQSRLSSIIHELLFTPAFTEFGANQFLEKNGLPPTTKIGSSLYVQQSPLNPIRNKG